MNFKTKARKRIGQAGQALMKWFHQTLPASHALPDEEPQIFAVTNCHPTRIVLYTAAFQCGWKVQFMKSLREAIEVVHFRTPKAVFYDHAVGDQSWERYCSCLSRAGVPFVMAARNWDDETFLAVLKVGGYQVYGNPLTSEQLVEVVGLASEMARLANLPVVAI
jgi:DNA-binding NtrC family response regulator